MAKLEAEIQKADPDFMKNRNVVLVVPVALEAKPFEHYIELRGSVDSRKNVFLSAQMGGEIQRVHVREGQVVSKGQVLITLNGDVLRNTVEELKNSHELATTLFERQEKLWNQKIGTEVQYLQARNAKESLEKRIAATNAQLNQMMVKAPFGGTIDKVDALEGQMASPGMPLVRMVSSQDMYISADISEEMIGKFKANDKVSVYFPAQDKKLSSVVTAIGQVINPENRTFSLEVRLTDGIEVKPNQVAIITLRDYLNPKVIAVPTKLIQRDNTGQYVYVVEKKENVTVAKKNYVRLGISFNGDTEILEGLTTTQTVIGEGFRDVTDGTEITISSSTQAVATK
jgi:membrane fusion protein, multidrug efflux system